MCSAVLNSPCIFTVIASVFSALQLLIRLKPLWLPFLPAPMTSVWLKGSPAEGTAYIFKHLTAFCSCFVKAFSLNCKHFFSYSEVTSNSYFSTLLKTPSSAADTEFFQKGGGKGRGGKGAKKCFADFSPCDFHTFGFYVCLNLITSKLGQSGADSARRQKEIHGS